MRGGPPKEVEDLWRESLRARVRAGEGPTFTAEGHSMWPAIRAGERVRLEALGPGEPRLGQVVLVVTGGRNVLHRVVGVRAGRVLLKGDAAPRPDGWFEFAAVVGVLRRRRLDCAWAATSRMGGGALAWFLGFLRTRA